jgi:hypothetical protein
MYYSEFQTVTYKAMENHKEGGEILNLEIIGLWSNGG